MAPALLTLRSRGRTHRLARRDPWRLSIVDPSSRELAKEGGDRGGSVDGLFCHRARKDVVELGRQARPDLTGAGWFPLEMEHHGLDIAVPAEREMAREQLVCEAAERIDIGPGLQRRGDLAPER